MTKIKYKIRDWIDIRIRKINWREFNYYLTELAVLNNDLEYVNIDYIKRK